jgi:uncharacterized peroxidase-related enzyme
VEVQNMSSVVSQQKAAELKRVLPTSSNLPLMDESAANDEVRALFTRYRERFARTDLPGILLCLATNSTLLKGMMQIAEGFLFGESLLSQRHKEMIATYLSRQNECPYCADSHAALLGAQGGSNAVICALLDVDLNDGLFTNQELELLKFTEKVNANSSALTRADVEALMRAGWTEAQVAEAVHIAALFAAFNRIANGYGLPTPYPDGLRDQL